jgi:Icc-related predicted phosphoesterase
MSNEPDGKILIISDVHGLVHQMNDFFHWILEEKKEKIAYVVSLGDFFKGRNFDGVEKTRHSFEDPEYFEELILPVFHLKGNEDLDIPENWFLSENTFLMKDQEPFGLGRYKCLPLYYQMRGEHGDEVPIHPEFSEEQNFDFIFSHRPPFGLLDHTLHLQTHRKLKQIGSPLVRAYVERLRPSVCFFGHLHFSNFMMYNDSLIVCIDKLIRIGTQNSIKYSYALVDPFDDSVEVVWKGRPFLKYSIPQQKILSLNRQDKRSLYVHENEVENEVDPDINSTEM